MVVGWAQGWGRQAHPPRWHPQLGIPPAHCSGCFDVALLSCNCSAVLHPQPSFSFLSFLPLPSPPPFFAP